MSFAQRYSAGSLGYKIATGLLFIGAYVFAYLYGSQFRNATGVSPFWPGAGVLLAWSWLLGLRQFWVVLVTVFSLRYLLRPDFEWVESSIKSLALAGGYGLAGQALQHCLPVRAWWSSLRELGIFLAITLPSCFAVGILGTLSIGVSQDDSLLNLMAGVKFGLGDFIGCLVCAPLIALSVGVPKLKPRSLLWQIQINRKPNLARISELAGQCVLLIVCTYLAFGNTPFFQYKAEHLLFLPMIWIVYRHGIKGAVIGGLAIAFASSLSFLVLGPQTNGLSEHQVFLITILLAGLSLGVLITGREETRLALEASQLNHQIAAEAAQDGLWEFNVHAQEICLSPTFKRILGDESLPDFIPFAWFVDRIPSTDARRLEQSIQAHLNQGVPFSIQHPIKLDSGRTIWLYSFGKAVRDANGNVIKMLGATNDITERKEAEEKIRQMNAELEKRVQERTAELQSANDELASFSYSVSHDLRGPLRSINGFAKLLGDEYGEHLTGDGEMYLERIRAASVRMSNLIDDLLQLSRMGKFEPRLIRTSITSIASGILDDLRIHSPDRQATITVATDLYAMADTVLVRNLLENLIQNAWKFTSQRTETLIEVGQVLDGDEKTFYVRDNGIGFDPKYSAKLFMPFERLHNDPSYQGSGIGLASVAKIVYLHGGRVWAESEVDKGSTFYFTLGEANRESESEVA